MAKTRRKKTKQRSPGVGISARNKRIKGKPILFLGLFIAVVVIMVVLNNLQNNPKRNYEDDPGSRQTSTRELFTKEGELTFYTADSSEILTVDIEIADDDSQRERGLMYRRRMEPLQGMLFIFPEEDFRSFWMKNTYIPLDLLYLNAMKQIVDIHQNTPTLSEESIPSILPAQYVVEMNAGFCAEHLISEGDYVTFSRVY